MQLTSKQESDVQKIMAEMDCPKSFPCYESGFEDIAPVKVLAGSTLVQCFKANESYCPKSFSFGKNTMFCECALRRYMALELGRRTEWQLS